MAAGQAAIQRVRMAEDVQLLVVAAAEAMALAQLSRPAVATKATKVLQSTW